MNSGEQALLPLAEALSDQQAARAVAEHIKNCLGAKATVVVDGNADEVIARMVAAGWTLREQVDLVAGKRIRVLQVPEGEGHE